MFSDSLIALIPVVTELVSKKKRRRPMLFDEDDESSGFPAPIDDDDEEVETEDRLVPLRWVYWGSGISIVFGTILVWLVFGHEGIKPWATLVGYLMGGLLSILG